MHSLLHPRFSFVLGALLCAACSAPAVTAPDVLPEADQCLLQHPSPEAPPDLAEVYASAVYAWVGAGVTPEVCVARVQRVPDAYMADVCDARAYVSADVGIDGCAVPGVRAIYVSERLQGRPLRVLETIEHELCHLMRGGDGMHLPVGAGIMAPDGGDEGQQITPADADFCSGRAAAQED